MFAKYVWADLVRNPRRTLSTVIGVALGVGFSCAVLFFIDGLSSSMTQRAVSPLPIDMQLVLTDPVSGDVRMALDVEPTGPARPGDIIRVRLTVRNERKTAANEVVARSVPAPGLTYLAGSAVMNSEALADAGENPFASGPAKAGLNIGTVEGGTTVILGYQGTASEARDISGQAFASTISTREAMIPVKANAGAPATLAELVTCIEAVDGVTAAEQLSFVDLPRGSLSATVPVNGLVRLFGFDASYTEHDRTIKIVDGAQLRGEALISAEAARFLSVGIHDSISLKLLDGTRLDRRISGIVDLTRARSLFSSRLGENLETFLYLPNAVIIDTATFADVVVPTFARVITGRGDRVKSPPLREIDVHVSGDLLDVEPAVALSRTERIAAAVSRCDIGSAAIRDSPRANDRMPAGALSVTNEHSFLLDNISNALAVARDDAAVAKRMFVFLSIPGTMLAALLGAYAGTVLAGAQRRERATLRIRGASRRHLLWMLWLRVSCITTVGAGIGLALGYVSVAAVLGESALAGVTTASLVTSAVLGTAAGIVATGAALYSTGRWAIDREIRSDRFGSSIQQPPLWQRYRLDLLGLGAVLVATVIVILSSGFEGIPGSVYEGRAVRLPVGLLLLPIGAWVAASLVGGRLLARLLSRLRTRTPKGSVRALSLLYWRSLKRRSQSLLDATLILGMIVALATSLAVFTASYEGAKAADARYIVGSDLKILPGPGKRVFLSADASRLAIGGIDTVVPVVYGVHNVVLRSHRTTEVANLAALDPIKYGQVAAFDDSHFSNHATDESLGFLADQTDAILLSKETADFLRVEEGDTVWVLLARATAEQVEIKMQVKGLFERLPGFPDGAHALMNIKRHEEAVASTVPAFFLGRTRDRSDSVLQQATETLRNGPGAGDALRLDTRLTALATDQSSLASLNINGLLRLDSAYSVAMGTVAVAIFVFGLLLQRRREYVTLRAQGMQPREIRTFIGAEAGTAAVVGCSVGVLVGLIMAYYLINVLRPLFVLDPPVVVPLAALSTILGSVLVATVVTSVAASALVNQLQAIELLRDE